MTTRTIHTYCRICEPQCGLVATVDNGRLVGVRGDPEHVHSQGFLCTKASAAIEVAYDPDRITRPMRRVGGPGEFEAVSWDDALEDIATRLQRIRAEHGNHSFATFLGNPPAFGYASAIWLGGFQATLDVKWRYGVNADDASARLAANALLYGSVGLAPKPDLWRTDFAMLLGANPFVSHGSLITEARFRDALDSINERGGRVVVVDPRRSETARRYDHLFVRPGSDAFLLLGIIHTLLGEDLVDRRFLDRYARDLDVLTRAIEQFDPELCAARSGVEAGTIRELARSFAAARSGVVYGRTGTCTQRFGTLVNILQDLVMILTGNIEREGGLLFGWAAIDLESFARSSGLDTFGEVRTRVRGHPDVFGMLPSTDLLVDTRTPGDGQVRALMVIGANPVISSAGGGPELESAMEELELCFALDLYVNETNKHAHYVLPVPHFYERDDFPLGAAGNMLRPSIWATDAVIEPAGEARAEWAILDEIARRMGYGGAYAVRPLRALAKLGYRVKPRQLLDLLIRTSKAGDLFGLRRRGLSLSKLLRDHPHGKRLRGELPTGQLEARIKRPDKKLPLALPEMLAEIERLQSHVDDERFPLRLIGMREIRSQNTWMHNAPRLMPDSRRLTARVNAQDAERIGLADGGDVLITSRSGSVQVAASVTDEVGPGTVALPHGWGHAGGWRRANAAGGVNSNVLASNAMEDIENLAGMSILNGIPIAVQAIPAEATPTPSGPVSSV